MPLNKEIKPNQSVSSVFLSLSLMCDSFSLPRFSLSFCLFLYCSSTLPVFVYIPPFFSAYFFSLPSSISPWPSRPLTLDGVPIDLFRLVITFIVTKRVSKTVIGHWFSCLFEILYIDRTQFNAFPRLSDNVIQFFSSFLIIVSIYYIVVANSI